MGHDQSKLAASSAGMGPGQPKVRRFDAVREGVMLHCKVDHTMSVSLVIPDEIAEAYQLKFQRCVELKDWRNVLFICEVEQVEGRAQLTKGWGDFMLKTGASPGDCMVFYVNGLRETTVWLFPFGCTHIPCTDSAQPFDACEQTRAIQGGQDVAPMVVGGADTVEGGGDEGPGGPETEESGGKSWKDLLTQWRSVILVGKNFELEDWMVAYIGSGMGRKLPDVKIFVGQVGRTSITENRMHLPRWYTVENVLPLLRSKDETFLLQNRSQTGSYIKFSIEKDGRAAFTVGWSDFAAARGIEDGSILAFRFSRNRSDLDIDIHVLD